jgi:hypothetical protein
MIWLFNEDKMPYMYGSLILYFKNQIWDHI